MTERRVTLRGVGFKNYPDGWILKGEVDGDSEHHEWRILRKPDGTYWHVVGQDFGDNVRFDLGKQIQDEEQLRQLRSYYNEWQGRSEICKCDHPLSVHTRNARETDTSIADDALLPKKSGDIYRDRPLRESGCTKCECQQYEPANS